MIEFLKYRYICLAFSILLFAIGAVTYVIKGGFVYHIDFVGGTEVVVRFDQPLGIADVRASMSDRGWKDLVIQSVGKSNETGKHQEFMFRFAESGEAVDLKLKADLAATFPVIKADVLSVSRVGAEVGSDIKWRSFVAVMLSLFIILLYVAIRSKYGYALGAVVALAHDMLAVLVVFLLLGEQISVNVLAAILAILGYSLNDTIVIFSRIRENIPQMQGTSLRKIVDISINQTLRRTILTSLATLLTVVSIFLFGGEALHGFALAMIVGIIFGTYSSIYIASPVMLAVTPEQS